VSKADPSAARFVSRLALAFLALAALALSAAFAPAGHPGSPMPIAVAATVECEGDACQSPPPAPDDPTPGTAAVEGSPNPPVHFPKHHRKKHRKKKRDGKKHAHRHRQAHGGGRS
jgi:outer membrane biosynthesis protein TonB